MSDQLAIQQPEISEEQKPKPKAIIAAGERGVELRSMEEMYRFAVAVVNSNIYKDLPSPEVALIKIQAGAELGLTPIWSLTNIFVVNGKPTVYGDALLGIVLGHPMCEDVIETFADGVAKCEVIRKGRAPVVRTFSESDAKKAGLFGKSGPWTSFPNRMLAMRARTFACRDAFADALRGIACAEEQRDIPQPRMVREVTTAVLPE
mgnify:CR=1 FL=1